MIDMYRMPLWARMKNEVSKTADKDAKVKGSSVAICATSKYEATV